MSAALNNMKVDIHLLFRRRKSQRRKSEQLQILCPRPSVFNHTLRFIRYLVLGSLQELVPELVLDDGELCLGLVTFLLALGLDLEHLVQCAYQ